MRIPKKRFIDINYQLSIINYQLPSLLSANRAELITRLQLRTAARTYIHVLNWDGSTATTAETGTRSDRLTARRTHIRHTAACC